MEFYVVFHINTAKTQEIDKTSELKSHLTSLSSPPKIAASPSLSQRINGHLKCCAELLQVLGNNVQAQRERCLYDFRSRVRAWFTKRALNNVYALIYTVGPLYTVRRFFKYDLRENFSGDLKSSVQTYDDVHCNFIALWSFSRFWNAVHRPKQGA